MRYAFEALAQSLTGRALNTALEGMFLAVAVWALLRVFGRYSSKTRFAIWFVALLAIAALPFLTVSHLVSSRSMAASRLNLPASFAFYLFAGWIVGVSLSLLKLGAGLWRVLQLRRNCVELNAASLAPMIGARLQEQRGRRRVSLCASDEVGVPTAMGFFRPAVVFPVSLLPEICPEEMEVILLHELAHLRRWDDWSNLAQKLVKAVFFFHPAVWWIERRLTLEREMACDEMVVDETRSPRSYAALLISFTEKVQRGGKLALVQGLIGRVCQLSLRIAEILAGNRSKRQAPRRPLLGLSAALFAIIFGVTAQAPQLISFQNPLDSANTMGGMRAAGLSPVHSPVRLNPVKKTGTGAPQLIPAAFHPNAVAASLRAKVPVARKPKVRRSKAIQPQISAPQVYVILRQAEYDVYGPTAWSICIWKVDEGSGAETQLESVIALQI